MIIQKERLIELLYHEDKIVRGASIQALERHFSVSEGILEYLLNAITIHKNDCLELSSRIHSFIPTSNDIKKIIDLFYETQESKDGYLFNFNFHLIGSMLSFPFEILKNNHELFKFNDELSRIYEHAQHYEEIRSQEPETLWKELERICTNYNGKELKGEDDRYAELLYEGLKIYPEQTIDRIKLFLSQETKENYHMEEYMVRLAGKYRIEDTIPFLFRIFNDSSYMHSVQDYCIYSLGKIGTIQVVNEIEKQYDSENELRDGLVSILGYIPYDYSEASLIRFLNEENDKYYKTLLCGELCDIFSKKATDAIIDIISKKEYDPTMSSLCDALIPVYEYYNMNYDLSFLKSQEADYVEEINENDPLHRMTEPLRKAFQQYELKAKITNDGVPDIDINEGDISQLKRTVPKVGRNSPCPCGSGKKYKKCCLLNKEE